MKKIDYRSKYLGRAWESLWRHVLNFAHLRYDSTLTRPTQEHKPAHGGYPCAVHKNELEQYLAPMLQTDASVYAAMRTGRPEAWQPQGPHVKGSLLTWPQPFSISAAEKKALDKFNADLEARIFYPAERCAVKDSKGQYCPRPAVDGHALCPQCQKNVKAGAYGQPPIFLDFGAPSKSVVQQGKPTDPNPSQVPPLPVPGVVVIPACKSPAAAYKVAMAFDHPDAVQICHGGTCKGCGQFPYLRDITAEPGLICYGVACTNKKCENDPQLVGIGPDEETALQRWITQNERPKNEKSR